MEQENRPCLFERVASAEIKQVKSELAGIAERVSGLEQALVRGLALLAMNLAGVAATLVESLSK